MQYFFSNHDNNSINIYLYLQQGNNLDMYKKKFLLEVDLNICKAKHLREHSSDTWEGFEGFTKFYKERFLVQKNVELRFSLPCFSRLVVKTCICTNINVSN